MQQRARRSAQPLGVCCVHGYVNVCEHADLGRSTMAGCGCFSAASYRAPTLWETVDVLCFWLVKLLRGPVARRSVLGELALSDVEGSVN